MRLKSCGEIAADNFDCQKVLIFISIYYRVTFDATVFFYREKKQFKRRIQVTRVLIIIILILQANRSFHRDFF